MVSKDARDHNFNLYAKYEKIGLTNLCFADDLLLFVKGDKISVEIIMYTFGKFSNSIGLKVNPENCCIYFRGVDNLTKKTIKVIIQVPWHTYVEQEASNT